MTAESWSLAEAAARWFPDLWALASDTTFCDMPGARAAWIAKRRLDPEEPIGRLLAAADLPPDVIAHLDQQRHDPGLIPRGIERARWAALCRADDDLHQRWHRAVRRAEAARTELARRFCDRMAIGEAVARGVAAARPLAGEVAIPPAAWRAAWPVFGYEAETIPGFSDHPAGCIVFGDGREVMLAVRIVEPPPSAPPRPGIEAARSWMAEHVLAARERWKMAFAVAACQRATRCTRAEARRAWAELPAEVRAPRR